jgi:hypothetical protein
MRGRLIIIVYQKYKMKKIDLNICILVSFGKIPQSLTSIAHLGRRTFSKRIRHATFYVNSDGETSSNANPRNSTPERARSNPTPNNSTPERDLSQEAPFSQQAPVRDRASPPPPAPNNVEAELVKVSGMNNCTVSIMGKKAIASNTRSHLI